MVSRILLFLAAASSLAFSVPLPGEGNSLNAVFFLQTQALINEHGSPDGKSPSYDLFVRRSRLQVNGDLGRHFSYYAQVDGTNFGKYGNFSGRLIVQDAFVGWAPTGTTGPEVVSLEGGIVYLPLSRGAVTSSANQPTAEGHPDLYRGFSSAFYSANRTTGLQVRGWGFGKRIGFRGGLYEGVQASAADPGLNPGKAPAIGGLVNFDLLGSEEGSFLYQSIYFAREPILSISVSGSYQSRAIRVAKGVSDQRELASTLFLDYPFSEREELIFMVAGYDYGNGTGSRDTGLGLAVDLGFRYRSVRPYLSWESFDSAGCPGAGSATAAQCAAVHTADSRNLRAGLDFYFNKTQNHLIAEFSLNRGQSSWGAQGIASASAGYVPAVAKGSPALASLARPAGKSLLLHWSAYF